MGSSGARSDHRMFAIRATSNFVSRQEYGAIASIEFWAYEENNLRPPKTDNEDTREYTSSLARA